jgi:nucleoside phosphorylase
MKPTDVYAAETLLIITPLPVEFKAMTGKLTAKQHVSKTPPVVEGRIGSARVIVALGGKGQELAATIVTRLDERFKPRYIFLVGVAGGFAPLRKGDVLIANSVHDLDYGKVAASKFLRRPELDWTPDHGLVQAASLLADGDGASWRRWIMGCRP